MIPVQPSFRTVFRSCGSLLLALIACAPASGNAQSEAEFSGADRLAGVVSKQGQPVGGVEVTLHRVTRDSAGVVATGVAGTDGSFAFRLPPVDTSGFTVFFATAEFHGVRYFGPPVHSREPTGRYAIQLFDTISADTSRSPIRLAQRDLVLIPEMQGGWEVNEVLRIQNPEQVTLVSRSGMPTWTMRIPEGVTAFEVGEGQFSAEEAQRMGDRVLITAPLPPGVRELYIRYRISEDHPVFTLPVLHRTAAFNVFIRQPSPDIDVRGLSPAESVTEGSETFLRFSGADLAAGTRVSVGWKGARTAPVDPIHASVATVLLVLGAGAWAGARRRSGSPG
jgi:hypothetical protein